MMLARDHADKARVVLLVERDEMVREAEGLFLETSGFEVVAKGCVQRYLSEERAEGTPADVIVLDYCRGCLRGPAGCVVQLRETFTGASLVMLCADMTIPRDGEVAGLVDAFLYKPTAPSQLIRTIADLIAAR
jgi:FixJ family two-component response regulator